MPRTHRSRATCCLVFILEVCVSRFRPRLVIDPSLRSSKAVPCLRGIYTQMWSPLFFFGPIFHSQNRCKFPERTEPKVRKWMNDRMHFQLNPSTIRSLNNSIFERQTLRRQPEVEIHFNKFGWGLYAGSGEVWLYVLFLYVFCLQIDGPINGGWGKLIRSNLKEQYPVTLLRIYQPLIF